MLARPPSIFDDYFPESASVGAPPPLGNGTGQLYLMVPSMMTRQGDLGPAVLLIKESLHGDTWGPPGGQTDATDHSPLHAALREFEEEVGSSWLNLANASAEFQLTRLRPAPNANEAWLIRLAIDAQQAENALFGEDRSAWTLSRRVNDRRSNEVNGYAFVPVSALLGSDARGNFTIGPISAKLRDRGRTMREIGTILGLPGMPAVAPLRPPVAPPAIAPTTAIDFIELHGIHLRITPSAGTVTADVRRAMDSQSVWGGFHVTITGFALRKALAYLANTKCGTYEVHGGSMVDVVKTGAAAIGKWRPSDMTMAGDQIKIKSYNLKVLEQACRTAGLARVKDATKAHVSIGDARYARAVLAALKDPLATWELGIAVLRIPCGTQNGQVVRFKDTQQIWP